jgi:NADPH2:quinone reductase
MPRAVVCRELGPPESLRLETFEAASLAPGQARVAIRAAGLNFPDVLMAAGQYQLKPPLPFTPGVEAAGDVVEVNTAEGVAVGDRVIVKKPSPHRRSSSSCRRRSTMPRARRFWRATAPPITR